MPKRKKRRQNDSSRAMQQALDHYECALRNLEDADERAALEALDFAEVFLERAQDDDVRRGLVAEVSLARGALLEVADPMNARLAYDRSFSADGNAAAALRAARLAWRCGHSLLPGAKAKKRYCHIHYNKMDTPQAAKLARQQMELREQRQHV